MIPLPTHRAQVPCPFCRPEVIRNQQFYETEHVRALYQLTPEGPGHCLIIPKRHVARFEDLSDQEIIGIRDMVRLVHVGAQKVFQGSAYVLYQKNGTEVGQSVFHVHVHYESKRAGDNSDMIRGIKCGPNLKPALSRHELQEIISRMREAIDASQKSGFKNLLH